MSTRYIIPDKVEIEASDGKHRMLSNDEIDVDYVYAALMARKHRHILAALNQESLLGKTPFAREV